jgi:hypothetical protein
MLRQQGWMQVDPTARRQRQGFGREDLVEMAGEDEVGPRRAQRRRRLRPVHVAHLVQRDAPLGREPGQPRRPRPQPGQAVIGPQKRQQPRAGAPQVPPALPHRPAGAGPERVGPADQHHLSSVLAKEARDGLGARRGLQREERDPHA